MNPIERASVHYTQLSKSERYVCDKFLKEPNLVNTHSITEIAEYFQVSVSAIQRFAKRLDYKGYSEFRYAMIEYLKQKALSTPTLYESEFSMIIGIFSDMLEVLKNTDMSKELTQLANILLKADTIRLCGIGNSALPSAQLMYMFQGIGKSATQYSDTISIGLLGEYIKTNDVVVFFTVSANKSIYSKYIKNFKRFKIPCIIITMNPESELISMCDLSIIVPTISFPVYSNENKTHHFDNRSLLHIFTEIIFYYYEQAANAQLLQIKEDQF